MGIENGKSPVEQEHELESPLSVLWKQVIELNVQGYGRAIVSHLFPQDKRSLAGYILPVNLDQTRHIVIFKSGKIIVTESSSSSRDGEHGYQREFSPSNVDIECNMDEAGIERSLIQKRSSGSSFFYTKILFMSDNPNHQKEVQQAIDQAINCVMKAKKTREETARSFTRQLDGVFGRSELP